MITKAPQISRSKFKQLIKDAQQQYQEALWYYVRRFGGHIVFITIHGVFRSRTNHITPHSLCRQEVFVKEYNQIMKNREIRNQQDIL